MPNNPWLRITFAAAALAGLIGAQARAQTASAPADSATAAPAPAAPSSETIQLSPFEVTSQATKGYSALNSNSITEFNEQLNKLPVSADVFDSQFMQDVGTDSVEGLIGEYSAGSGVNLSNPGGSAGNVQPNDRNGNTFLSIRGLTAPTMQLNGLMPLNTFFNSGATGTGYTNTFNIERADVVFGPQALLYGVGGAGGVINLTTKQAYLGQPAFMTDTFRVDNWGHKYELLDLGAGSDWFAVRIAVTSQDVGDRRVNIGGPMNGQYGEIAIKLPHNTVLRIDGTQTDYNKNIPATGVSYSAISTATDARNGASLRYLLATNQLQAAANGAPSGGGYIGGGTINWNNLDSFGGNGDNEETRDTYEIASLDTAWTDWLSTRISAGYRAETDLDIGGSPTLLEPGLSTNPFPGAYTWQSAPFSGLYEPLREKVIRGSVALTNNLFHDTAKSQTLIGADYTRADGDVTTYGYVAADANFKPTLTTSTSNNGYTFPSDYYFPLTSGPSGYPVPWGPGQKNMNLSGTNYTFVLRNDTNSALVGPGNPLGLTGHGSGDHRIGREINKGIYLANSTDWFDGRFTTLLGMRVEDLLEVNQLETGFPTSGDLVPGGNPNHQNNGIASFNAGVNYRLLSWLRPYVQVSDSDDPPAVLSANPYGLPPDISHGIGEEAGLKIATPDNTVSGTISFFHASSYNEQYSFTSTLTSDINPSGLNGRYGAVSNFITVDRRTQGLQATITANPTPNWRLRLSASYTAATILTGAEYPQFYNDQFHTNSAGDVTFADGDIVYVAPTFNSKTPTVTASTPGAIPLTLAQLNNASGVYYANPQPINSQILASSAAGIVLRSTEPGTGSAILTGVNGLPITDLQVAPNPLSPPPGKIVLALPGDMATGFPKYGANITSLYTIPNGPAQGFSFGGTASASWEYADYYYYTNGLSSTNANSPRSVFYLPTLVTFNGIFKYERKIGRFGFSSQLNINNMFNHYHMIFLPNATGGNTVTPGITFDAQPRWWQWTNTFTF